MLRGVGWSTTTNSSKMIEFMAQTAFLAICWALPRLVLASTISTVSGLIGLATAALHGVNFRVSTHISYLLLG